MPLAALREHQHELADLDERDGFLFGTEDTGYLTLTRPKVIAAEQRNSDTNPPQEDGRNMGRDYRGGKSYQFEVGVLTDRTAGFANPHRANNDYLGALGAVWNDERWRNDPQAYAVLRTCEAGRVRRAYGRPRAYDEVAGKLTADGYTPVAFQFDLRDDRWYADGPSVFALSSEVSGDVDGLAAPLVAPLSVLDTSGQGIGEFTVGGDRATWCVVEFVGPCTNPQVLIEYVPPPDTALTFTRDVAPVRVGLVGTIPADQWVTYDPQPWRRTVLDSAGVSRADWATANTTMMTQARLWPGTYRVTFDADDSTGTARVNVSWRDAYERP